MEVDEDSARALNGGFCAYAVNRGSYISIRVLLNLLKELGKVMKCEACRAFYLFFATRLINQIIQEHEC